MSEYHHQIHPDYEQDKSSYRISEILVNPEIIGKNETLCLIGPGKGKTYSLGNMDDPLIGPMDSLSFPIGYLGKKLYFMERPEEVKEGGLKATNDVFNTLQVLVDKTGYQPFQVIRHDMKSKDVSDVRKKISETVTYIDNGSHRFWGSYRQDGDPSKNAPYVIERIDNLLKPGDRYLLISPQGSIGLAITREYLEKLKESGLSYRQIQVTPDDRGFALNLPHQLDERLKERGEKAKLGFVESDVFVIEKS